MHFLKTHFFSKFLYKLINIYRGFHHLQVHPDTIPLLGFTTPIGVYSWLKVPMFVSYNIIFNIKKWQ